ncbi:MAG: c-type cytochrome, partial [Parachlamydiaceae bacterium]
YESEIGYAIEKDNPSFEARLKESEWFKKLFPEDILGSKIAKAIDEQGAEIDKRIVKIRDKKILEKIEEAHPGLIESFYASFKFASRAKNKDLNETALKKYQERLHKVLMMYVVEYGLGRLIGPRPNFAGVYRTDEWLMEHFKAPTAHIPRSIMPVMPFDETKFYALTYMLDVIGKKNRDDLRKLWDVKGFKPDQAYETLCAQCHGPFLQGNGPVAEWIYPPPKNLRKTDFLPNLTLERTKFSLKHGVKGTPMPPYGEAAIDKPTADGIPVLSDEEINKLADWLFSLLPGMDAPNSQINVPKWDYGPDDVIEDLKNEGQTLEKEKPLSAYFPKARHLVASNGPSQTKEPEENPIFDRVKNPFGGPDPYHYYIKKEYYTPENIEAGKRLFYEHCAVCHGKEGDGAGARAEAMYDAKPRMLINLDWINFRDDVRMIRSIKFGVPGTSMVAWGDQTSSLQRLQLVIFIRTLTQNANARKSLFEGLYRIFDVQDQNIERARQSISKEISRLENEYKTLVSLTKEKEKLSPIEAV